MTAKTDTNPKPTTDYSTAGIGAEGEAENTATLAIMALSIHQQGEAARTNLMGEAAKAQATIHD